MVEISKKSLIQVNFKIDKYTITGFVGNLSLVRKRRGNQFTFINGRYIINSLINQTVYNTYDSLLQRGEFPLLIKHCY